jgi:hypothetical protein
MSTGLRTGLAAVLLVVLVIALAGACGAGPDATGSSPSVERRSFEARLVERDRITDEQAQCVSDYVYAGYQPEEIRVIYDEDFTALPKNRWNEYGHAMVGCLFHDQLVPSTGPSDPSPVSP